MYMYVLFVWTLFSVEQKEDNISEEDHMNTTCIKLLAIETSATRLTTCGSLCYSLTFSVDSPPGATYYYFICMMEYM